MGLGNMGRSHALALHRNTGAVLVGLVNRSPVDLPPALKHYPIFESFSTACLQPDLILSVLQLIPIAMPRLRLPRLRQAPMCL